MIKGNNVILRRIEETDTCSIVKWRNTESVIKNFFIRDILTEEQHLWWFNNRVKTGQVSQFIIIDTKNYTPVGSVFLRDIDHKNKKAEFGIFIGEEIARGKGIGSESAKLICEYGFNDIGLHKIFLRVFAHNIQAIKSYRKSGFNIEGILKEEIYLDGNYCDVLIMSKINEEKE